MKKAIIIALVSVIMVAILGIGGFFIWKLNTKIDEQNDEISKLNSKLKEEENTTNVIGNNTVTNAVLNSSNTNTANTVNNTATNTTNNTTTTSISSDEEIKNVKNAFEKLLADNGGRYSKYKVDSVRVLNDSEKQDVLSSNSNYKTTDTLAYVNYSVIKADSTNTTDWIPYENICVCYRDGQIVNFGTKW